MYFVFSELLIHHRPPSQVFTEMAFIKIMSDYDLVILIEDLNQFNSVALKAEGQTSST